MGKTVFESRFSLVIKNAVAIHYRFINYFMMKQPGQATKSLDTVLWFLIFFLKPTAFLLLSLELLKRFVRSLRVS